MDTIFMNSESGKIRIVLNLSNKINLKKEVMNLLLYQIIAYIIHQKI